MKDEKILKVAGILSEALSGILMGEAGRVGTPKACRNFLKGLDDDEKVIASFGMGILGTVEDADANLESVEDYDTAGLASVLVLSKVKDKIMDLIKTGFNPGALLDDPGNLVLTMMGAGRKLSDLLSDEDKARVMEDTVLEDGDGEEDDDGPCEYLSEAILSETSDYPESLSLSSDKLSLILLSEIAVVLRKLSQS